MDIRCVWIYFLGTVVWLSVAACNPSNQFPVDDGVVVSDARPRGARPFRLQDVRLLTSDFQSAMELSQEYLLALDQSRLLHTFRINAGLPRRLLPWADGKRRMSSYAVTPWAII